jgi:hypothetical protein
MINTILLYKYDTDTNEFIGSITTSNMEMKDSAGVTDIPPPENPGGKVYHFIDGKWKSSNAVGNTATNRRNIAQSTIDTLAEDFRTSYITSGSCQTMVYDEKYNEAIDYVTKKYPSDLNDFPYIATESEITGKTGKVVADTILARRSECMSNNVKVETCRLLVKQKITNVSKQTDINALIVEFTEMLTQIKP